MTKQEQIEEIARVVIGAAISANSTHIKEFLNNLYDAGYRKAEKVRKETAKEILQTLYDKCFKFVKRKRILGSFTCYVASYDILELAKQYGVEVEE